jgi:hypothetical protein
VYTLSIVKTGKRKRSVHSTKSGGGKVTKTSASSAAASKSKSKSKSSSTHNQRIRSTGNPRVAVSARVVPELRDRMDKERVRLKMANLSEFMERAIMMYLDKIRTR